MSLRSQLESTRIKYISAIPSFLWCVLIRTLLHQLVKGDPNMAAMLCPRRWAFFHATRSLDPKEYKSREAWELVESLDRLLDHQAGSHLMLFIDGLDEFDIPSNDLCSLIQRVSAFFLRNSPRLTRTMCDTSMILVIEELERHPHYR
jgi:hypothetical protein